MKKKNPDSIDLLGWDSSLYEKSSDSSPDMIPVRITAVHRESFHVSNGEYDMPAELSGRLRFYSDEPEKLPCVGDWVMATLLDDNSFAIIHEILPRASLLKRKNPGIRGGIQLIAANIDYALIVQSLDRDFNLARLERYLVIAREGKIIPVILLSKSDLAGPEEISAKVAAIRAREGDIKIIPFSSETGAGLDTIREFLEDRKTYALLGSSGVGKTTLLNYLSGKNLVTGPVRAKDSRGKHTTTARELIRLEGGALLIDNPGMRELGIIDSDKGMAEVFEDVALLAEKCLFNDCRHMNEKGCAVLAAVNSGQLDGRRYENYIKLQKEAEFHDMTMYEKRQKDKKFGKMVKNVMKEKKQGH